MEALVWTPIISTPLGVTYVHEGYPWIQMHHETARDGEPWVVVFRIPGASRTREVYSRQAAEAVADEYRLGWAKTMLWNSHPVVPDPDSVTHWTCPKTGGETHHLVKGSCRYCGAPEGHLRIEQAAIIASGATR